jgi:hypothetical protein
MAATVVKSLMRSAMALVQQRPKSKRRDIQGLMSFGMMVC